MYRITERTLKKSKLDVKDKKLLVLLSENSRSTINELAKKVQLKRDTVAYRIKRMEQNELILRYFPEIDYSALGFNQYHVFFVVDESDEKAKEEFIEYIKSHPGTLNLIEYSDRWDFEWRFIAKDFDEFDDALTQVYIKFSSIIQERAKLIHRNTFYSILLPYDFHEMKRSTRIEIPKENGKISVDEKDLKLLKHLSENSRQSTYELSKKISLSADAIRLRIKRLEKKGVIQKYTVTLNLSKLGYHWYTFAQQMKIFDKHAEAKFQTLVKDHPYIIKAVKTIGYWDVIVYIIAKSAKNFHKTIKQLKREFSDIIDTYSTFVAYEEHIFNPFPDSLLIGNK